MGGGKEEWLDWTGMSYYIPLSLCTLLMKNWDVYYMGPMCLSMLLYYRKHGVWPGWGYWSTTTQSGYLYTLQSKFPELSSDWPRLSRNPMLLDTLPTSIAAHIVMFVSFCTPQSAIFDWLNAD